MGSDITGLRVALFGYFGLAKMTVRGGMMDVRILAMVVLAVLLSACGREEPATQQEKTFGSRLGDSYKGMLDGAKQGVGNANEQIKRNEQAVRERSQ